MTPENDNDELNQILRSPPTYHGNLKASRSRGYDGDSPVMEEGSGPRRGQELKCLVQWTTADEKIFVPASNTAPKLSPGLYEITHSPTIGIYFQKTPIKTEGLLRFPQTNNERVVREIEKFWDLEGRFREYGLSYKRGIIMWGP